MISPKSSFLFALFLGIAACSVDVGGPLPAELSHYDPSVVTDSTVEETETPPPPKAEADINPPPSPQHVWVGGYWARRGAGWKWVEGRWVARAGSESVESRWECLPRGAVRVPGSWR